MTWNTTFINSIYRSIAFAMHVCSDDDKDVLGFVTHFSKHLSVIACTNCSICCSCTSRRTRCITSSGDMFDDISAFQLATMTTTVVYATNDNLFSSSFYLTISFLFPISFLSLRSVHTRVHLYYIDHFELQNGHVYDINPMHLEPPPSPTPPVDNNSPMPPDQFPSVTIDNPL